MYLPFFVHPLITEICKLIGIWPFQHCSHDWDTNNKLSIWYSVHGNLRSLATMDLHQARCEARLSPACEHAFPSSRAEMLIRTIAETNMALWTLGRPGER